MAHLIDKDALVAEIQRLTSIAESQLALFGKEDERNRIMWTQQKKVCELFLSFIDTLEVKDPYEQCIQYPSVKDGIEAHAETYSFNTESELFNQLTKEQQALWRKEIEQACISGGYVGYGLAKDLRYKENFEVKEVDLDKEIDSAENRYHGFESLSRADIIDIAKHFFELGLKVRQG